MILSTFVTDAATSTNTVVYAPRGVQIVTVPFLHFCAVQLAATPLPRYCCATAFVAAAIFTASIATGKTSQRAPPAGSLQLLQQQQR